MELKIKKTIENVELPSYATDGAGGFDIRVYGLPEGGLYMPTGTYGVFQTGLSVEIPKGWSLLIIPRSGLGSKKGLTLRNGTGLIDSDYRGEITLTMIRDDQYSGETVHIHNGDRLAQGVLVQTPQFKFVEVEELSETIRGEGGHGSTGVA